MVKKTFTSEVEVYLSSFDAEDLIEYIKERHLTE